MGEENMKRLKDDSGLESGVPTAFIRAPRLIKEMWDRLHGVHRLTLSFCMILESPRQHAKNAYIDLMTPYEDFYISPQAVLLHLGIKVT